MPANRLVALGSNVSRYCLYAVTLAVSGCGAWYKDITCHWVYCMMWHCLLWVLHVISFVTLGIRLTTQYHSSCPLMDDLGPVSVSDKSYCKISWSLGSHEIGNLIALKYDRHTSNIAARVPVRFQSDCTVLTTDIVALRLRKILKYDIFSDIQWNRGLGSTCGDQPDVVSQLLSYIVSLKLMVLNAYGTITVIRTLVETSPVHILLPQSI